MRFVCSFVVFILIAFSLPSNANKYIKTDGQIDTDKVLGLMAKLTARCSSKRDAVSCIMQCSKAVTALSTNEVEIKKLENPRSPKGFQLAKEIAEVTEQACFSLFENTAVSSSGEYIYVKEFIELIHSKKWPEKKLTPQELFALKEEHKPKPKPLTDFQKLKKVEQFQYSFDDALAIIKSTRYYKDIYREFANDTRSVADLQEKSEKMNALLDVGKDWTGDISDIQLLDGTGANLVLLKALNEECNYDYLRRYRVTYDWPLPSRDIPVLPVTLAKSISPMLLQQLCFYKLLPEFEKTLEISKSPSKASDIETQYLAIRPRSSKIKYHTIYDEPLPRYPSEKLRGWENVKRKWQRKIDEQHRALLAEIARKNALRNTSYLNMEFGPYTPDIISAAKHISNNCGDYQTCKNICDISADVSKHMTFITHKANNLNARQQKANQLLNLLESKSSCLAYMQSNKSPDARGDAYYQLKYLTYMIKDQHWPTQTARKTDSKPCHSSENPFKGGAACEYLSHIYYGDFVAAHDIEYQSTEVFRKGGMGENLKQLNEMVAALRAAAGYNDPDIKKITALKWKAHTFAKGMLSQYLRSYSTYYPTCLSAKAVKISASYQSGSYKRDRWNNNISTGQELTHTVEYSLPEHLFLYNNAVRIIREGDNFAAVLDQSLSALGNKPRTSRATATIGLEQFMRNQPCGSSEAKQFESQLINFFNYRNAKNDGYVKQALEL